MRSDHSLLQSRTICPMIAAVAHGESGGHPREGDASMNDSSQPAMAPSRRTFMKTLGVVTAAGLLQACGSDDDAKAGGSGGAGNFPETPEWRFVFVNHVTTNPFFVPTIYGIEDASAILGTTHQWTGSEGSDIGEMVNAMEAAIGAGADGIGVALVDLEAFNGPTDKALAAGIPVRVLQRRRSQPATVLHRPGPLRLGLRDGQAHRRVSSAPARSACSSRRPGSSTSSRASTARSPRSASRAPTSRPRTSRPAPTSPRSSTTSRRGTSATRTPSACSRSMPAARRRSGRW